MSFFDSIFGGESTKGIKFQRADNERRQDYIEQQTDQARNDVLGIIPKAEESLRQGYSSAIDVSRRTPQDQLSVLQGTARQAQDSVLGGMQSYQNAILGLPIQPMQASTPGQGAGAVFNDVKMPAFLAEPQAGSATPTPLAGIQRLNVTPGQTTNAEILSQLYKLGKISDYDYNRMKESHSGGGSGDGTGWSYGKPASEMMGWLPDDLHPRFRETNENIFNAINRYYPT